MALKNQELNAMKSSGNCIKIFFQLLVDRLSFYDLYLVVESEKKNFMLGSSSDDIQLRGKFETTRALKLMIKKRASVCPVRVPRYFYSMKEVAQ